MKVFVTVSVVVVVFSLCCTAQEGSEAQKERIQRNRQGCILETKVDPQLITRADNGDFVDDDRLKCFTKCFYQKAGFVTENGDLRMSIIRSSLPANIDKGKAMAAVEACRQYGKDACETVYLVHKCYFEFTSKNDITLKSEVRSANKESTEGSEEAKETVLKDEEIAAKANATEATTSKAAEADAAADSIKL